MPDFNEDNNIPAQKWYKTTGGIIFLLIISLVILVILAFTALASYYAWQIKYGKEEVREKLTKEFSQSFSVSGKLSGGSSAVKDISVEQMSTYIRPANPVFGNGDAKVKVLVFIDFECPYCRSAHSDFKKVMDKYQPVVQFVFKNLPLSDIHAFAGQSASAGMCANEQKMFWSYHDLLFTRQLLDDASLLNYSKELGLDEKRFDLCLKTQRYDNEITADLADAVDLGLRGTPTYFVNGKVIEGVISSGDWDKIILSSLNQPVQGGQGN